MLSSSKMMDLLRTKIEQVKDGSKLQAFVLHRGYLKTSQGLLVSKEEALEALSKKKNEEKRKEDEENAKEAAGVEAFEAQRLRERQDRERFEHWALKKPINTHGVQEVMPYPMKVREVIYKERKRDQTELASNI